MASMPVWMVGLKYFFIVVLFKGFIITGKDTHFPRTAKTFLYFFAPPIYF